MSRDSKSTNERDPSLVGLLDLSCPYKRFFFFLGCFGLPCTKYFFLTVHNFNAFAPISQQTGQATVLDRLSFSMCLWLNESSFRMTFNPSFYPNVDLNSEALFYSSSVSDPNTYLRSGSERAKSDRINIDNNPDPDPDQAMP